MLTIDSVKHPQITVVICISFLISVALRCSCFGIRGKLNGISAETFACVLIPKWFSFLEKFNLQQNCTAQKYNQRESIAQSPYETILKLINVSWSLFTICIIGFCIIQKHAI